VPYIATKTKLTKLILFLGASLTEIWISTYDKHAYSLSSRTKNMEQNGI